MATTWQEYQEEAAEFFRSLGLDAQVDASVEGSRTSHDVDVLVNFRHVGFEVTWLVECKFWKEPVSKLHVLGLRQIVSDVGADRGIILSEKGFQSGAIEAANLTNVQVTSLAEFTVRASEDICSMQLRNLYDRIEECNQRYWDISKEKRILHGLRPDFPDENLYSGALLVELCRDLLARAFRGSYPIKSEDMRTFVFPSLSTEFYSSQELATAMEPMVTDLEERLTACESS